MSRDALLARMQEARHQRCVVVQGPAGSGKTSTLVAWRQMLVSLDFDVAWLSLAEEDNEPTRFLNCVMASLEQIGVTVARDDSALLDEIADESATESAVVALLDDIRKRPRDVVLVLDDVHLADDPRILHALQWLLDYAPDRFHLALGTRLPLALSFARLRSHGHLSTFELRDLRFSAEESERYLRRHIADITERDARKLHELTDGWVAGLQLFALDLKAKRGTLFTPTEVRDARGFASYFEREVLSGLASQDLDLLTAAAVGDRFCASLCAALVGEPHAVARMTTRLVRIDSANLFISQLSSEGQETWYRLHPLLREVLLGRLDAMPASQRKALHGAAWRWFDRRGQVDEAVRHAVMAGEMSAAADAIQSCAAELLAQGDLGQLASLLQQIPPDEITSRFTLQVLAGHFQLRTCRLEALARTIESLSQRLDRLDALERYALLTLRGGMALMRDDLQAATALLPELETAPEGADDFVLTARSNIIGWVYMCRGEHDRARKLLTERASQGGALLSSLLGRCLAGMSHAMEGRILQAEAIFREALRDAEHGGPQYVGAANMATILLADALYELNEIDVVCDMLGERVERLERRAMPDGVLRARLMLALSQRAAGRRLDANANLDRLEEYAIGKGLDRLLAYALNSRLCWQSIDGEHDDAARTLARLQRLRDDNIRESRGAAAEVIPVVDMALGWYCVVTRNYEGALEKLLPLLDASGEVARGRRVVSIRMLCAAAEAGRGGTRASREHLLAAANLGRQFGLVRSVLNAAPQGAAMLRALMTDESLAPALKAYIARLADVDSKRDGKKAPAPDSRRTGLLASLSEREMQVLKLIAQAMANKMVARTLNVSPETVKWHLKNIYIKLCVGGRDEAVALLRDANLG